jgi:hypothetical protein
MGASGSAPPNDVFCCNIRSSKVFVRSAGSGWSSGMTWTMNVAITTENKPACQEGDPVEGKEMHKRCKRSYKKQRGVQLSDIF